MNLFFKKSILIVLFVGFFSSSCKPLTKKEVIGYSVAAAAGAAVLTGTYLFWWRDDSDDSLDNFEVVEKDGEKILQEKKVEKKKVKQILVDVLKFMIIPSAVGLGAYWVLDKHTPEGKLRSCESGNQKVVLGLGKKFSDGKNSLTYELKEEDLIKLVNSNFGKNTNCPLIEAERYLKEQKEQLQLSVSLLEELKSGNVGIDSSDIVRQTDRTKNLSDKISVALDSIQKQKDYQEQLKRYDSFEKDRIQREELSSQRKYDFAKILLIIAGASSIAGKIVAPFV